MTNHIIKKRKLLIFTLGLIFSVSLGLIAGYRPFGIGMDFTNYDSFYSTLNASNSLSDYRYEPAFVWLAVIFKHSLHLDYMAFAAALMTTSILIKTYSLSKLEHPLLAIMFYTACWFPLHENTQIRTAIAIAFLFLALDYMLRHQWAAFIVLAAIASTFHTTALLAASILIGSYWLSSFRLYIGISAIIVLGLTLSASIEWTLPYLSSINQTLEIGNAEAVAPNYFSAINISVLAFLLFSIFSDSLTSRKSRTVFLVVCTGFAFFWSFINYPVLAHRLKEIMIVFMTLIAFEYRITARTLPQATLAVIISGGSLYLSISGGLFSN